MNSKLFVIYHLISVIIQTICELDQRVITTLKYSKAYVQPTVVHGKPAVSGQIPYLVSIKKSTQRIDKDRIVWDNLCGGSIISELKVLTAAHCFEREKFFYAKNPYLLRIVAGNLRTDITHSGRTETNIINQWRNISRVVLHSSFYFPYNDIALVFVNEKWKFKNNVDYIVAASKNFDYSNLCIAAGYGRIGYGATDPISPILLSAKIIIMPKKQCSTLWEMNMNTFICSKSSFTDVSNGDSGGPLACKNTLDPKEMLNRDLLVGIVCGKNFDKTTLYTRVSTYSDWIDRDRGYRLSISFGFIITIAVLIYLLFYYTPEILIMLVYLVIKQKGTVIKIVPNERLTFQFCS